MTMTWKSGGWAILAAGALALPGVALGAENEKAPKDPEMGAAQAGKTVHGQLTQVLKSDHELLLSDQAAPLVVAKNAKISRDGKTVSFGDLKPGDDIRAAYDASGVQVISIEAQSAKKMMNNNPSGY